MSLKRAVGLVGLGPHARHHEYQLLDRISANGRPIEISVLIELESNRPVTEQYLATRTLQPQEIVWIDDADRNSESISRKAASALEKLAGSGRLDGLIISTEPKAHMPYMMWAMENGVAVAVDKPITVAPTKMSHSEHGQRLSSDFHALLNEKKRAAVEVIVLAPRRAHPGYLELQEYVAQFVDDYGVGITQIEVTHAGGVWNLPGEWLKENHPYHYGYGGVMHSGYHQLDTAASLLSINDRLLDKRPDTLHVCTQHTSPLDIVEQMSPSNLRGLFRSESPNFHTTEMYQDMGEVDVVAALRTTRRGRTMTTGTIRMLQTSLSGRREPTPPLDPYKGSGRIRQESLSIYVGTLLSVRADGYRFPNRPDEFKVQIGRSPTVGSKPYEEMTWTDGGVVRRHGTKYATDLSGIGHEELILNWLDGRPTGSELESHELTVLLASATYESMGQQDVGRAPYASVPLASARPTTPAGARASSVRPLINVESPLARLSDDDWDRHRKVSGRGSRAQ